MTIYSGGLITDTIPRSAIEDWAQRFDATGRPMTIPGAILDPTAQPKYSCWACGARPLRLVETTTFKDPEPTYIVCGWALPSRADHEHAPNPPTPEDLAAAGRAALRRILEDF